MLMIAGITIAAGFVYYKVIKPEQHKRRQFKAYVQKKYRLKA